MGTTLSSDNIKITDLYRKCYTLAKFKNKEYKAPRIRLSTQHTKKNQTKNDNQLDFFKTCKAELYSLDFEQADCLFEEIHWCIYEIQNNPNIDEKKICDRIKEAEEELILGNRLLLLKELNKYTKINPNLKDDARQEILKALTRAIRTYDISGEVNFYTYAQAVIKNKIKNICRDLTRKGDLYLYKSPEQEQIEKFLKENPTADVVSISKKFDISKERTQKILNKINVYKHCDPRPESLNAININTGEEEINYIPDVQNQIYDTLVKTNLINVCAEIANKKLSRKESLIFRLRFVDDLTLEEIGKQFNLTRARTHQIEKSILKKIKFELSKDITKR